MNEVLRSSRFWVSVLVCVCATVLASLGRISGDLAVGVFAGLVGGFGVGKTWGGPPVSITAVPPPGEEG